MFARIACVFRKHQETTIFVTDSGFGWRCPRCHKKVNPPDNIRVEELKLRIADAMQELDQFIEEMALRKNFSAEDKRKFKTRVDEMILLKTRRIANYRYGRYLIEPDDLKIHICIFEALSDGNWIAENVASLLERHRK